jgi:hypothetical protein
MDNRYNYQCICGHVGTVSRGSALEDRAKKRAADGYLDAIILSPSECEDCQLERQMDEARYAEYDFWSGK